jgi:ubiquinone/menaquinone biosynthesis C-methylase UbiE
MMPRSHFVERYEETVQQLLRSLPLDEAMSSAVGGGSFDKVGAAEADVLTRLGLSEFSSIIDLGCGSGRLAKHLGLRMPKVNYLGIDIVQELLDYAATQAPSTFRFVKHQNLNFPVPDQSFNFIAAFSVFTHLLYEETYCYLTDAHRVLVGGGAVVMSFLELPYHWTVFEATVKLRAESPNAPLNIFHDRSTIDAWARRTGFDPEIYFSSNTFGQSIAVLRKV